MSLLNEVILIGLPLLLSNNILSKLFSLKFLIALALGALRSRFKILFVKIFMFFKISGNSCIKFAFISVFNKATCLASFSLSFMRTLMFAKSLLLSFNILMQIKLLKSYLFYHF